MSRISWVNVHLKVENPFAAVRRWKELPAAQAEGINELRLEALMLKGTTDPLSPEALDRIDRVRGNLQNIIEQRSQGPSLNRYIALNIFSVEIPIFNLTPARLRDSIIDRDYLITHANTVFDGSKNSSFPHD